MLVDLAFLPLAAVIAGLAVAAALIVIFGTMLARRADEIADATGLGEAIVGAILLGATTSLPGIIVSVTTAAYDYPALAISNAIGGITAQTAFLAIADITYRRANLEHAAASIGNMFQGALLICLLAVPLAAASLPGWSLLGVSPATVILLGGYVYGQRLVTLGLRERMWQPRQTHETKEDDDADPPPETSLVALAVRFAGLAAVTALAGFALSELAVELSGRTGLAQTTVGGLLTATVSSLPELTTSIAAVRRGALTLAVGGIIGGNAYDVLFLAFADVAYRDGSLYAEISPLHVFTISITIIMTSVLLLGMLRRERSGPGGIGFESFTVLLLYGFTVIALVAIG